MATASMAASRQRRSYFYVWMAGAFVIVAFGGFAPTYWMQLPAGTFVGAPLLHIHGALFSAWTLLLLSQTMLAAAGKLDHHRAWGLAGIALASAMVVVGLVTAIHSLEIELAAGNGNASRSFFAVPISALALFAGFMIAAIANIRRPEAHKRWMLLATIALLQAAMGRLAFVLATGGGPGMRPGLSPPPPMLAAAIPSLLLELFIIAGIVHDWRTRGRPHRVWLIGGAVMTAAIVLRGPLGATPQWIAFADSMTHLAG
jgi:hypothetical protein